MTAAHRDLIQAPPLKKGWNPYQENDRDTQLDFGIHLLEPNQNYTFQSKEQEIALLILKGSGRIEAGGRAEPFERNSWIDQSPWAVHSPANAAAAITALSPVEVAVVKTPNPQAFPQKIYLPDEVETEHRGQGMLEEMSYRIVRCVFDRRNAPPEARLVLGEVVNFPGRWSSYPPHHHPQPELYFYQFEPDWGYGHGELGETVYKIRNRDLLRITGERDHSQTSAPGFMMYYLWTIRHFPDKPYTGFEYTAPFETLLR